MKKSLVVAALALSCFSSAYAYNANVNCYINGLQATCEACNNLPQPMNCGIHATGFTSRGANLFANQNVTIMPGQCAYAYVYTNPYDPFVNVSGNAFCN